MSAFLGATTTVAEAEALRAELAELRSRYDAVRTALMTEQNNAKVAVQLITERMLAEAEQHGFCDTFDHAVAELNNSLPEGFPRLGSRIRTWRVTGTFIVTIEREIEAVTQEEAEDKFDDDIDPDSLDPDEFETVEFTTTLAKLIEGES